MSKITKNIIFILAALLISATLSLAYAPELALAEHSPPDNSLQKNSLGYLGGLDLNARCQYLGFSGAEVVSPYNVYSWRCYYYQNGYKYWTEIDVTKACKWYYGNSSAKAAYWNFNDPYTWYCYY